MLAHVFESAGIATVTIGSIREQLYNTAPPRGLFCDFPLGRPLGKPNDAEFQQKVICAAFELLKSPTQIIRDFGEIITEGVPDALAWLANIIEFTSA